MASHGLSQPFQHPKITTWWNTLNLISQQHLPHSFRQVLGSQMISSKLHFFKWHFWREQACNKNRNNPNFYLPIWVLIPASASFPGKPFHISCKHGTCDWSFVVHQSQQKPLITLILHLPQQDPVLAISPLEAIYPSWSWGKYALVMMSSCPPMRPLRQAYAKAPKGFSKHILRDLGTSAMPAIATIQPQVTCFQGDPFWDTRLRFRMYTVFRASVWRVSPKFTRHQLLILKKVDVWQLQS